MSEEQAAQIAAIERRTAMLGHLVTVLSIIAGLLFVTLVAVLSAPGRIEP